MITQIYWAKVLMFDKQTAIASLLQSKVNDEQNTIIERRIYFLAPTLFSVPCIKRWMLWR
jgi:hypothetical protein